MAPTGVKNSSNALGKLTLGVISFYLTFSFVCDVVAMNAAAVARLRTPAFKLSTQKPVLILAFYR